MRRTSTKLGCIVVFFFLLVCQSDILAQNEEKHLFIGTLVNIKSEVLGEERPLLVYLPDDYNQRKLQKYPVLYLLDGSGHFHHATGIVQFLGSKRMSSHMIVVGIASTDRMKDLTPTRIISRPNSGGADNFLMFIRDELIPFVDKNYRTQPYRILFGHSLAGMFALYNFVKSPDMFNAYIVLSPWLIYDNECVVRKANELLEKNEHLKKFLFIAVGSKSNLIPSVENFKEVIEDKEVRGLEFKYLQIEKENHITIPHLGLYNGLQELYSGWRMPEEVVKEGSKAVKKHYKTLSEEFGYEIKAEFSDLYILGMGLLQQGNVKLAIDIFKFNAQTYPNNWAAYSALGEAYRQSNNIQQAIKNFEKALELNPNNQRVKEALAMLKEKK